MTMLIYPAVVTITMQTITACLTCDSADVETEVMVLAMGQEGVAPKEIVVVKCNDCGKQHQVSS